MRVKFVGNKEIKNAFKVMRNAHLECSILVNATYDAASKTYTVEGSDNNVIRKIKGLNKKDKNGTDLWDIEINVKSSINKNTYAKVIIVASGFVRDKLSKNLFSGKDINQAENQYLRYEFALSFKFDYSIRNFDENQYLKLEVRRKNANEKIKNAVKISDTFTNNIYLNLDTNQKVLDYFENGFPIKTNIRLAGALPALRATPVVPIPIPVPAPAPLSINVQYPNCFSRITDEAVIKEGQIIDYAYFLETNIRKRAGEAPLKIKLESRVLDLAVGTVPNNTYVLNISVYSASKLRTSNQNQAIGDIFPLDVEVSPEQYLVHKLGDSRKKIMKQFLQAFNLNATTLREFKGESLKRTAKTTYEVFDRQTYVENVKRANGKFPLIGPNSYIYIDLQQWIDWTNNAEKNTLLSRFNLSEDFFKDGVDRVFPLLPAFFSENAEITFDYYKAYKIFQSFNPHPAGGANTLPNSANTIAGVKYSEPPRRARGRGRGRGRVTDRGKYNLGFNLDFAGINANLSSADCAKGVYDKGIEDGFNRRDKSNGFPAAPNNTFNPTVKIGKPPGLGNKRIKSNVFSDIYNEGYKNGLKHIIDLGGLNNVLSQIFNINPTNHVDVQHWVQDAQPYYTNGVYYPLHYAGLSDNICRNRDIKTLRLKEILKAGINESNIQEVHNAVLRHDTTSVHFTNPRTNSDSYLAEYIWSLVFVNAETRRHPEWNFLARMFLENSINEIIDFKEDVIMGGQTYDYVPKRGRSVQAMGKLKREDIKYGVVLINRLKGGNEKAEQFIQSIIKPIQIDFASLLTAFEKEYNSRLYYYLFREGWLKIKTLFSSIDEARKKYKKSNLDELSLFLKNRQKSYNKYSRQIEKMKDLKERALKVKSLLVHATLHLKIAQYIKVDAKNIYKLFSEEEHIKNVDLSKIIIDLQAICDKYKYKSDKDVTSEDDERISEVGSEIMFVLNKILWYFSKPEKKLKAIGDYERVTNLLTQANTTNLNNNQLESHLKTEFEIKETFIESLKKKFEEINNSISKFDRDKDLIIRNHKLVKITKSNCEKIVSLNTDKSSIAEKIKSKEANLRNEKKQLEDEAIQLRKNDLKDANLEFEKPFVGMYLSRLSELITNRDKFSDEVTNLPDTLENIIKAQIVGSPTENIEKINKYNAKFKNDVSLVKEMLQQNKHKFLGLKVTKPLYNLLNGLRDKEKIEKLEKLIKDIKHKIKANIAGTLPDAIALDADSQATFGDVDIVTPAIRGGRDFNDYYNHYVEQTGGGNTTISKTQYDAMETKITNYIASTHESLAIHQQLVTDLEAFNRLFDGTNLDRYIHYNMYNSWQNILILTLFGRYFTEIYDYDGDFKKDLKEGDFTKTTFTTNFNAQLTKTINQAFIDGKLDSFKDWVNSKRGMLPTLRHIPVISSIPVAPPLPRR